MAKRKPREIDAGNPMYCSRLCHAYRDAIELAKSFRRFGVKDISRTKLRDGGYIVRGKVLISDFATFLAWEAKRDSEPSPKRKAKR